MADFTISPLDISSAEDYLVSIIQEKFPDLDVGKGSALRDILIAPFAFLYATLRKQFESLRARQSLLTLSTLEGDVNADELVDQILSNWMLSRNSGTYARGKITVYLSSYVDVIVPANTQFFRTSALVFYPDTDESIVVIERTDLKKSVDANGSVLGYFFELPVKAAEPGSQYNIAPGNFSSWTFFSAAVTKIVNNMTFTGGKDAETTTELLSRAKTAVATRDLNSIRAIDTVLRENFASLRAIKVKGFGEYVLRRNFYAPLGIHLGGFADVFIRTESLFDTTFNTIVGIATDDPRSGYYVLKDETISDFTSLIPPAQAQEHMIHLHNAASDEPTLYKIMEVVPEGLRISREQCFPRKLPEVLQEITVVAAATDYFTVSGYVPSAADKNRFLYLLANPTPNVGVYKIVNVVAPNKLYVDLPLTVDPNPVSAQLCTEIVEYTAGNNYPSFDNKISNGSSPRRTGLLTKEFSTKGRILLPFRPVYYIKEIVIPGSWYPPWADADNKIRFTTRVNTAPSAKGEYRVVCNNPEESNSGWQLSEIILAIPSGKDETFWDGAAATITYDTMQDFDSIWDFMLDDFRRVACANIIPRGMFAAYLTFTVNYSLKPRGTAFDHAEAIEKLVKYINTYPEDETLDVSDIIAFLRQEYSAIDSIAPLQISYTLFAPDGRVIAYRTTDKVSVDVSYQSGTFDSDRLDDPLHAGVSDDLVFYITRNDMITLERV